jgi:hypothetical protein
VALLVALLAVPAFTQPTQPGGKGKTDDPKAKPNQPAAGGLEDLLSQALKNNPDIRVGEAKVREAEAELNRTRMTVAQKVVALYHSIDIGRKARDESKANYDRVVRLSQTGAVAQEDFRAAKLSWERAAAELAKLEAEMPALLGKLPDNLGAKLGADAGQDMRAATEAGLRFLARTQLVADEERLATQRALAAWALSRMDLVRELTPQGSLAQRIRKALDKQITADYKGKSLGEVLNEFGKLLDGIPFRVAAKVPAGNMDLNLGQVPLGTAIQAFNDLTPETRFVVRDYGILVTAKEFLPPGAIELHDFWKSDAGKERPKAEGGSSESRNPPSSEVHGSVKAVDAASGLVTISVGSDAGLAKGHTLEVYRLGSAKTGPKYLGTIRVLDVRADQAVGKPLGKLHDTIQTGDNVATKLTEK